MSLSQVQIIQALIREKLDANKYAAELNSINDDDVEEVILVEQEEEDKGFSSQLSYILLLIGNVVGFGNIWRFPYLMHQHGGVVFLIPYLTCLFIFGIPVFCLELGIGQRLRKGSLRAWMEISKYLGGLGVASCAACIFLGFYYNTLIAWCWHYFFSILSSNHGELGWTNCFTAEETCETNLTEIKCEQCQKSGPTSHYWYNNVLHISEGINDPGEFSLKLFGCLVLSWITIWCILVNGIRITGRVAYVTALLPYTVLLIFFIRGLTLKGMEVGFEAIFLPNWHKLLEGNVWFDAGIQIFFSLGLGFGVFLSFSSIVPPNNNCLKDATLVCVVNFATSLFAAIMIFPTLGFKGTRKFKECNNTLDHSSENFTSNNDKIISAYRVNKHGVVEDVILCDLMSMVTESANGPGLIFIAYTEAIKLLPFPQGWALIFFMMLIMLGIGSEFCVVEGAIWSIHDWNICNKNTKEWIITTAVCGTLMCCSSIIFCWGWGEYVFIFFDAFSANWSLLILAFVECIGIAWIYGLRQFSYDIHLMTGSRPNLYLLICWRFISPIALFSLFVVSIAQYFTSATSLTYEVWNQTHENPIKTSKPWPVYMVILGLTITSIVIAPIPLFAILALFKKYPIKSTPSSKFPEVELRALNNITYCIDGDDASKQDTFLEKILYCGISKKATSSESSRSINTNASKKINYNYHAISWK